MSDKKNPKHRVGPSSSKFILKLQNSSRTEEDTSNNGEKTPVRRFDKRSGHSTPIRNSITSTMEDSPEMDARCSPIMGPCTQQNEVIWNWNSPKGENNSTDVIRTPKRTAQLQKRRISDSPLMYGPLKVKLKKDDRDVNVFMANFEQFNNPSGVQRQEDEPEPSTSKIFHFESQNHMNSEKNLETSDEVEMRLVYPVDESRMDTISERQNITNFNDFFNDEIDDSMVRCSQQVEEEFLGRVKQEEKVDSRENKSTISDNKGIRKIKGIQDLIKIPFEKSKEVEIKPVVLKEKCITIPDDSFDECLSQFVEDDFSSASKNVESPRAASKGLQIRNNDFLPKKCLFSYNSNNTSIKVGSTRSCCVLNSKKTLILNNNERLFAKTKSFDSHHETHRNGFRSLANDLVQKSDKKPEVHVSPRKFFKTKSLSEPFHNDPKNSSASNKNKQETNNNPSTENIRKVTGKSFKCKIYSDTSLNRGVGNSSNKALGSSQDSVITIGNNFDNVQLSNLNRSMERLENQRTNDSQAILCTPQEIERKRIEAKMKLEAKRRLLLSSKTNSAGNLPITQSIKR